MDPDSKIHGLLQWSPLLIAAGVFAGTSDFFRVKVPTTVAKGVGYCKGLVHHYWPLVLHRVWGAPSVEVHHRHYIIKYSHGFDEYKILAPRRRGPCKFTKVLNERGDDVTKQVKQFMGPSHNFHGIPTTVDMLGYAELTFVNELGDIDSAEASCSTFKTGEYIEV